MQHPHLRALYARPLTESARDQGRAGGASGPPEERCAMSPWAGRCR